MLRFPTSRPLHVQSGELDLELILGLGVGLGPGGEGGDLAIPLAALLGVEPADLAERDAFAAAGRQVVDPDADAEFGLVPLDDEGYGVLGRADGGERRDAPVGVAVAGDGAELRGAVVELEAGLDPLGRRGGGVCSLGAEGEEEAGLVVLFGPGGVEGEAGGAEGGDGVDGG